MKTYAPKGSNGINTIWNDGVMRDVCPFVDGDSVRVSGTPATVVGFGPFGSPKLRMDGGHEMFVPTRWIESEKTEPDAESSHSEDGERFWYDKFCGLVEAIRKHPEIEAQIAAEFPYLNAVGK